MSETARLLDNARNGDSAALDDLMRRHRGRLAAFAQARLRRAPRLSVTAEDIVQETHLEAARKLGSFVHRGPTSFYRWLVTIAGFKVSEAIRSGGARKRAMVGVLDHDPLAAQTSPSGRVARAERAAMLVATLDELPGDQAEAVRLRYLEGLSVRECAARLDRSEAAVKMLVSRGLGGLARHAARLADSSAQNP